MISIIICSYQKDILEKTINSIEHTIGITHEIIVIENAAGNFGLCKAYNTGAEKAKFDILCFMHEDIIFETNNWGLNTVKHLADKTIGLIGVAGGDTKGRIPSGWASMTFKSEIFMVQHYKHKKKEPHKIIETATPLDNNTCKKVACLDGMWLCTRRDVFEKIKFDDVTFTGFHGYDIDYSLQVNTAYKVCAVSDVLIHHFSEGVLGKEWLQSAILMCKKWKKKLPFSVREISKAELVRQHWTAMGVFIDAMFELNYSFPFILNNYLKYAFNRFFHLLHFLHFFKIILLRTVNKKQNISL